MYKDLILNTYILATWEIRDAVLHIEKIIRNLVAFI